ncbi:gliding motility-associated C-terminal domain-containing protein [Pontimicrobium sp. MEBiC06410]
MKSVKYIVLFIIVFFQTTIIVAQDITLFSQFNGRYDYLAIGNTLNQAENNLNGFFCETLPSSEALLNVDSSSNVIAAYLYWAGSGSGDMEVTLNSTDVVADETYTVDYDDPFQGVLTYFSCYADVTDQILAEGNTMYELSNLDISETLATIPGYCTTRTNFAGWSLYVIFENNSLPLNQVNLFQGLEIINRNVQEKTILLNNVNVLDNDNAKIGFLAWEGDNALNYGESISINGNLISNPPLNEVDNAFNGTNSFTNATNFYNCDLDVYGIENNIVIGDTEVEIKLTTGAIDPQTGNLRADLIIINNIITVLNSQLPDATIVLDDYFVNCGNRTLDLDYTVNNLNSTASLPSGTIISFYAETILIGQSQTFSNIVIGGSESGEITLQIPNNILDDFLLSVIVDDDGNGNGNVIEIIEINNEVIEDISLIPLPETQIIQAMEACDIGFNTAIFDLTINLAEIEASNYSEFSFYETIEDLQNDINEILIPENYQPSSTPTTIFIRAETAICFDIFQFELLTENCPPYIPDGFSPNNDGFNDFFNIQGLYDIFENHELLIYNRYGTLIFQGNNDLKWYGKSNRGINSGGDLPSGTYFYVLHPNDSNFKTLTGWVYLNR